MTLVAWDRACALLLSETAATAVSRGLAAALRAMALLVVARSLPVEAFGGFGVAFALLEICRQLSGFGLDTVLLREVAVNRGERALPVVVSSICLKLALAIVGYGVVLMAAAIAPAVTSARTLLAVLGLVLFPSAVSTAIAAYFQATLQMARFAPCVSAAALITLAIVAGTAVAGASSPNAFALAFVLGEALGAILFLHALGGRVFILNLKRVARQVRPVSACALLRVAWPVALTQALVVVYFRFDVMMLAWLERAQETGLYAAAFRITEPFLLVPSALAASFYGAASQTADGRIPLRSGALSRVVLAVAAVYGVLAASAISVLAPFILRLLTPGYEGAAQALQILAWSLAFMPLNMVMTAALNARGRFRLTTVVAGATLLVCLTGNVTLIPRFGMLGASLATVVTEAANSVFHALALGWSRPGVAPNLGGGTRDRLAAV